MKKTKWVSVNRFYFPGDLPEAVGRPCGLETCEVIFVPFSSILYLYSVSLSMLMKACHFRVQPPSAS